MQRAVFSLFLIGLFALHLNAAAAPLELRTPAKEVSVDTTSILFTLSEPAIDADQVGRVTNRPVIDCAKLAGSFAFEGRDKIRFYPAAPLPAGARITCRPGPDFFSGQETAAVPAVITTEPLAVRDIQIFRDQRTVIRLEFNDTITFQSLSRYLRVFKKQHLAETALKVSITPTQDTEVFLVTIEETVAGAAVGVAFGQRVKSVSGSAFEREFEKIFPAKASQVTLDRKRRSLVVYDNPRAVALPDGRLGIRIYLGGSFYSNNIIQPYVEVEGAESIKVGNRRIISAKERKELNLHRNSRYAYDVTAELRPHTIYKITLKQGLRDGYYYELKEDKQFEVTTGDRLPALRFESSKPYLSSSGEVGFQTVNIDKVNFIVERLTEQNYRYFINFMNGAPSMVARTSEEVFNREVILGGALNTFTRHKLSLKPFVQSWKSGVYRLSMRFKDRAAAKVVYLSDIGLAARLGRDQLFVAASSLATAEPVARADVFVYSVKNMLIAKGSTNSDGVYVLEKADLAASEIKSVVVEKGNDRNFLVLGKSLNGVKLPFKADGEERYRAMVYLQRKLVRPDEDVHFAVILKDKYFQSPADLPVRVKIFDPANALVLDESRQTGPVGAFTFSTHIATAFKTGKYRTRILLGDREIGHAEFNVETFLPQRIKSRITVPREQFRTGEPVEALVESRYLFGATAAGLKTEVRFSAVAHPLELKDYEGYSFNDLERARKNKINYIEITTETTLDQEGRCQVVLPTQVKQKAPSILKGLIGATVFDDGQPVAAYREVTLYPYRFMVGLKLLSKNVDTTKPFRFRSVLLDPLSGKKSAATLYAKLKRRMWHWVIDENGQYRWSEEYKTVDTFTFTSDTLVERTAAESGLYLLEVEDRLGGHRASAAFHIRGWGYDTISPTDDMGDIQVEFEPRPYRKGDVLHIALRSPIGGRLMVSLEGRKVMWHRFYDLKENTASLDIPLEFDFKEGLYLHTFIVRSTAQPGSLKPFRAKSYDYVQPDLEAHRITVGLQAPERTQSNRSVTINVRAEKKQAVALVSVVDEGILQIVNQQPPRPFDFFLRKEPLRVALYDLYDMVMHHLTEGRRMQIGGDDAVMLQKLKKHLAPDTGAKRVKPFVFWSGLVPLDTNGRAEVTLQVPEFTGRAQIVALVISSDGVGTAHQPLVVKDDVIVNASFPRFGLTGDVLDIPVRIFNTTAKPLELRIEARTSENLNLDGLPQQVVLAPNAAETVGAKLTVQTQGKGEVKIVASGETGSYHAAVELPLYTASVLHTEVYSGETGTEEIIEAPEVLFSEGAPRADIAVSELLLSRLRGSFNSLVGYPYGCAEQTSSRMLAMVHVDRLLAGDVAGETAALQQDRKQFLAAGIEKLRQMQRPTGDFTYWQGGDYVNPYASVYASDVLLQAQQKGIDVPAEMIRGIHKSLAEIAAGRTRYERYGVSTFTRLYAAYLLADAQKLSKSLLNTFYDRKYYKNGLVQAYMVAAMLKMAGMQNAMKMVLMEIERYDLSSLTDRRQYGADFYSRPRDIGFALYLHARHFQKNPISDRLLDAVAGEIGRLYSTQDKAFALRGLQEYYKNVELGKIDVDLTVNGKTRRIEKATVISEILAVPRLTLRSHKGPFFYSVDISGYRPLPPNHGLERTGRRLWVDRTYVNEDGSSIDLTSLKKGSLIYARVRVGAVEAIDNLIINDRVPACFEIVNRRLDRLAQAAELKNSNYVPDHVDIRDDRVLTFLSIGAPQRNRPSANEIVFYTPLRVTYSGRFQLPAVQIEAMYDSRLNDYDLIQGPIHVNESDGWREREELRNPW